VRVGFLALEPKANENPADQLRSSLSFGPRNALYHRSNGTSCRNGMDLPGGLPHAAGMPQDHSSAI